MKPRIAYFAYNLSDPSINRRVKMLSLGGARVTVIGFRRERRPVTVAGAAETIDLGETQDSKLLQRSVAVARVLATLDRHVGHLLQIDGVIARNLEMLVLAAKFRDRYAPKAVLAYESLDIHKRLLSTGVEGTILRHLETKLWRNVDLLLTSSPAFVRSYFVPRGYRGAIKLVENKVLLEALKPDEFDQEKPHGPPWRIGWFGLIRCERSLQLLGSLASASDGMIEIIIRGRPSSAIFPDLSASIADFSNVRFLGQYKYPDDLRAIYGETHFSWAVDFYEEGLNSSWLLPNRMYESSLYKTVPIALRQVETGKWLSDRGAGVIVDEPIIDRLREFFQTLNMSKYSKLAQQVAAMPRSASLVAESECRELVRDLVGHRGAVNASKT